MPQASRVTRWSASPSISPGGAIGVDAVASRSRRCHRRAESPAGRPGLRSAQAARSASTPSQALQGDATGEPNHQLVELVGDQPRRRDRRPRRRAPFEAMPQASRVISWSTLPAIKGATRSASTPSRALRGNAAGEPNHQLVDVAGDQHWRRDRRPRRRQPFEAMPQASRVISWSTLPAINTGDAIGAHAVASRSRRCRRRAESSAGEPRQRSAPAKRSASSPSPALRGDATGEPNHQLVGQRGGLRRPMVAEDRCKLGEPARRPSQVGASDCPPRRSSGSRDKRRASRLRLDLQTRCLSPAAESRARIALR
jgi:hypothetical protein